MRAERQTLPDPSVQGCLQCFRTRNSLEATMLHRVKELHPDKDSGDTPSLGSVEDTPRKFGSRDLAPSSDSSQELLALH